MLIGISAMPGRTFRNIHSFLSSSGWSTEQIREIRHPNDAAAVRQQGGLVIHVEASPRPCFNGDITSEGLECRVGDFVLEDARNPMEYLPRLLAKLTRLLPDE